ncbi:DOMON domain-containing protein FRRS1L isoform X1 [Aquarana catesbeiana]|uniref:DOMON domain-containing protein FRRS1L isoform X1 n=1 Tax=Aquarana catesbeiana TaxID=8400 RepID=UPI003CC9C289
MILLYLNLGTWLLFISSARASPADESAARGGHPDQGDAALDEKHQDTYGTFASEFYDLRYLSEEGYPFPTAPPVDPFARIRVDDCGKTKGCFRYGKPGCNAETCDYFLSYRRIGADVEFELSADTDGWVAVGFSSDKKMGGDDVMACVHDDNGRVRIQHFYNVGQWAKEIQRNPARDEEGVFENNRVTCRFKRPVYVPRDETIVDLHLSWYYLFAWGPAIQGKIMQRRWKSLRDRVRRDLTDEEKAARSGAPAPTKKQHVYHSNLLFLRQNMQSHTRPTTSNFRLREVDAEDAEVQRPSSPMTSSGSPRPISEAVLSAQMRN